ncbi:MAG TPA: permease-like cell division protein FtsX [Candidatus Deferrimicrobiaceae bacterium]|nr:permease-like cell division protein FtsX [Candidatus Deferrimicrobiaceae bacterium]
MGRETAGRFLLAFLVASYFLAMLLSGGVDRFLSEQYTMTAILRVGVPDEEGTGIEGKVVALSPVREAKYRNPEEAWKEFLLTYPGLESLRGMGKNPLPGYVEIRLRPKSVSEEGIDEVRSALEPLPQVEKVLSGGAAMPRLLRMKRWANVLLWIGFALMCAVFLVILSMQEKSRAARLFPEVSFLADRGVPEGRIAAKRTAGAFVTGGVLILLATACSGGALYFLSLRFRLLRVGVGPAQELLDARFALPVVLFLLSATVVQGLLSLAGWRSAFSKGR